MPTGSKRPKRLLVGVGAAAAWLAVLIAPDATRAATVSGQTTSTGGKITYAAAPGETNDVSWRAVAAEDAHFAYIEDSTAILESGGGSCQELTPHKVKCQVAFAFGNGKIWKFEADLGNGNDSFETAISAYHGHSMVISGQAGNDILRVGGGVANRLAGGSGNDRLRGATAGDTLLGGSGNDRLTGGSNADTLDGGGDVDRLRGGLGIDTLRGGSAADRLFGEVGTDTMEGDSGDDVLTGGPNDDTLSGGRGIDTLRGGNDDDVITGGLAADQYFGGPGIDEASYAGVRAPVKVDFDNVADDGVTNVPDNVHSDVENATGGIRADTLTGNGGPNILVGGRGNDTLAGLGGDDRLAGEGSLAASQSPGNDLLLGGEGADDLEGDGANDDLNAGNGNDRLAGGDGTDLVKGNAGDDELIGDDGPDNLSGGPGLDEVDYGAQYPFGNAPAISADIDGQADDGASGEGDNVQVDVEVLIGSHGSDTLTGNDLPNTIVGAPPGVGSADEDILTGLGANDILRGARGNDELNGGTGSDALEGGDGDDLLTGGTDLDEFDCGAGTQDRVTDKEVGETPERNCELFGPP